MSKRCLGCMEQYDDEFEVCPYCGYVEGTSAEVAYHIQPGEILVFRYIIGKVLGYGSFGVTYLGWDSLLEKKVAIKEYLPNEFATRAEGSSEVIIFDGEKEKQFTIGKDKFSDEAKKLAAFNKENGIITVYDQFEDNGTSYIVMDYFEGETLQQLMNREGRLPYERAIEIVLPILKSLQSVHDAHIIHRDISPDNIYITKDNQVKLLDFGAARYASTNMSKSLSAIYKQGFAPYEQYQSSKEQGPWSDVYALAATLYYMITGIIPQESMNRLTKEDDKLIPPKKIIKEIPKNLNNAIMNAMIVYPTQRTQSVTEFKNEIENIQTQIKKIQYPKKFLIPQWAKMMTAGTSALLVILCLLIGVGVIDLSTILGDSSKKLLKDNETYIPGLLNMYLDEAEAQADDSDVVLQIIDKVQNEKVDANKIMSQDPRAGLITIKDGVVNVVVSKGEQEAVVPDVTYEREAMAKSKIEAAGFNVKIVEEEKEGFVQGIVIKQSIEGNRIYGVGGTITLTIAKKTTAVPSGDGIVGNYTNMELKEAIQNLYEHGLYAIVSDRVYNNTVPTGQVISQSMVQGTHMKAGEIVELTVSLGKETVLVPDVQYLEFSKAKEELEKLGFVVKSEKQDSDIVQKGKIIKQDLVAGKQVDKGSQIKLIISNGSKKLTAAIERSEEFNNQVAINNSNSEVSNNSTSQSNNTHNDSTQNKPTQSTTQNSQTTTVVKDEPVQVVEKKWSDWTTDSSLANDSRYYVEKKTQYRSRTRTSSVEKTTSTSSSLSGWTKAGSYVESSWGSWSSWSDNAVSSTSTREVQTRQVEYTYNTGRKEFNYSHWAYNSGGQTWYTYSQSYAQARGGWYEERGWSTNELYLNYLYDGKVYGTPPGQGIIWFYEQTRNQTAVGTKTQYRYRTLKKKTIYKYERTVYSSYSSFGAWQDAPINETDTTDVETRIVYRYKEK